MTDFLTLNMLIIINGIIDLQFLELSIIILNQDILSKVRNFSWSANRIGPGQTARTVCTGCPDSILMAKANYYCSAIVHPSVSPSV